MRVKIWIVGAIAATALAGGIVYFTRPNRPTPQLPDTCRIVAVSGDVQDVAVDDSRGVAYLAYTEREGQEPAVPGQAIGTVMLIDLNAAEPRVRAALTTDPPDFRPAALNVQQVESGAHRLWVVSGTGATIETFQQTPTGNFTRIKTVADPQLAALMAASREAHAGRYVTRTAAGSREILVARSAPRLQVCNLPDEAASQAGEHPSAPAGAP